MIAKPHESSVPPLTRSSDASLRALDAVRGYASVIVLLHHFTLAFLPGVKTAMNTPVLAYSLGWLVNGMGAVYVFFVLSGFVLTLKYFQAPTAAMLLCAAAKRLPRLWPSALYGTLLGYFALRLGWNPHLQAAQLSGSAWLTSFADADLTRAPDLALALRESLTMFLHYRPLHYNTNLWTMLIEFYGSLLAFFAAVVLVYLRQGRLLVAKIGLGLGLLAINILLPSGFGWAFSLGAALAFAYTRRWFVPMPLAFALMGMGLALLGTPPPASGAPQPLWALPGAVLLLWGLTTPGAAPRFLLGRFSQSLGCWSFPLYITHSIAILTLGSYTYTATAAYGPEAQLLASFAASCAAAIAAAYPVLLWEAWYLPRLNHQIRRLFAGNR